MLIHIETKESCLLEEFVAIVTKAVESLEKEGSRVRIGMGRITIFQQEIKPKENTEPKAK